MKITEAGPALSSNAMAAASSFAVERSNRSRAIQASSGWSSSNFQAWRRLTPFTTARNIRRSSHFEPAVRRVNYASSREQANERHASGQRRQQVQPVQRGL